MRLPPVAVEIWPALRRDAAAVAANLRDADRAECAAAGVDDFEGVIADGIEHSALCWTAWVDGQPAAVFGVRAWDEVGVPWMLGTDAVQVHRRAFIQLAPAYIDQMLQAFPRLLNHVHARNTLAVRWLKHAGFALQEPHAHPSTGEPFHVFTMDR